MNNTGMIFDIECTCGHVSHVDTNNCDKYVCPKCGATIFEKTEYDDE